MPQLKLIERQFAAGDDDRPFDAPPAEIDGGFQFLPLIAADRLASTRCFAVVVVGDDVQCRVEDCNDRVLGADRVRDVNVAAVATEKSP